MTRPPDGTRLRGQTFLVAEHGAAEHAGVIWYAKKTLPEPAADRWPVWACVLIWAALLVPIWAGIIATLWWML